MSQTLTEFRRTYRPPDNGQTRTRCPGLMQLDLRILGGQFHIPTGDCLYDHQEHGKYPAAYVSGRLWGDAEVERQWTYKNLKEAGYIGIEIYFPIEAYRGEDPFYGDVSDRVLVGKSLAFLLASNLCVRISETGAYSLAEQALAAFLGIPVVTAEEFDPNVALKTVGRDEIDRLIKDELTVLEHINRLI